MRRRNRQAGQALYLTAASLVVLLGFLGLGIDMGVLRYEKRLQQTAADAAALAGASNLGASESSAGVVTGAMDASSGDGFTDNSGNGGSCASGPPAPPSTAAPGWVQVTVCNGPSAGPHAGDANYVEAWVTAVHRTYFMPIFDIFGGNHDSATITARAVATNVKGNGWSSGIGCIYTLGAPQKKIEAGFSTSGSVSLQAPQCGISDNGDFIASGANQLNVQAASIGVSGSVTENGQTANCQPTSGVCPQPVSPVPASGDPVSVTAPCSDSGCTGSLGSVKITNGTCSSNGTACGPNGVTCNATTSECTVQPNTYDDFCVQDTGSGSSKVIFSDGGSSTGGLFILTGASTCSSGVEFKVNAGSYLCNSSNLDCSGMTGSANNGVTFYLTGSGSVNINGGATVQLTAPNSGTYEGLLFYQDPNDTASATLSGTDNSLYQGTLYFPTAQLTFGGNNTTCDTSPCTFNGGAAYTFIVSSWLTLAGNPTIEINSDVSGLSGNGGPLAGLLTTARLVE